MFRPFHRLILLCFALQASLVLSAINLDGSPAVEPASADDPDDPSPINDPSTYEPDQHDCPPPCVDYANTHSWIPYLSVERLERCKAPMLLELSVSQPVDSKDSTIFIRTCTLNSHPTAARLPDGPAMKNPKKDTSLVGGGSLKLAPACFSDGVGIESNLTLIQDEPGTVSKDQVTGLLDGLKTFFEAKDNCDEKFMFAYHQKTVAAVYIGSGLGRSTVGSSLDSLTEHLNSNEFAHKRTVAELCSDGDQPSRIFGVSVDTTGDLAAVQRAAIGWSTGSCHDIPSASKAHPQTLGVKVFDLAAEDAELMSNRSAPAPTNAHAAAHVGRGLTSRHSHIIHPDFRLKKRAECKPMQVQEGDTCTTLSVRCGIRGADFTKYNTKKDLCSNLEEGDYVCCSAGDPFTPPKPTANADGSCKSHLIANGDTCAGLATKNKVTVSDLSKWNDKKTWGWTDCENLLLGYNMCIGPGLPPLPPPQKGATCGPTVPGTTQPKDSSTSMADLNPCPLKACCSNWGFCGIFPDHCKDNSPPNGAPGSKKKGFQNTCVSNCGTAIKQNSGAPKAFSRIGYYAAFGRDRDCLRLKAKNANTDGSYTHIHWAFASIDPKTFKPVINQGKDQWSAFKKLKAKRIVSFGGWADSTEAGKYQVIRSAIIQNRVLFATNLAQFAKDEGIDGIDIDWEYPGAPDIMVGGSPIGEKSDGLNYLRFLTVLREKLASDKSVSIAAPASYWYLKQFPIDDIGKVVDYIVYMTYDLHGQWDYGNPNAFDECPSGKCIRSHVNMTETKSALSLITKAGVDNNKIFVGEASYGRSFRMAKEGCQGPMCEFTGTRIKSNANPGKCTKTPGYLANAEINDILKKDSSAKKSYDKDSESYVMLYKGDYVSYMDSTIKDARRRQWKNLNFAGSIDWSVDLQEFTSDDTDEDDDDEDIPESEKCVEGDRTYSSKTPRAGEYMRWLLMDLENAATTGRQYVTIVNLTPHNFKLTSTHSYQMDEFDWDNIPPGKARQNVAHYTGKVGANPVDTNGEAYYSIEGTNKKFHVRATTRIPDDYPRRIVFDLTGMGAGQREYKAPEQETPVTLVITGSDSYGFIASLKHGPGNWMNGMAKEIANRTLTEMVMPGSHDAGMSKVTDAILTGAIPANTQTQGLSIYDQLRVGSRFFDLRVSSVHQVVNCCGNYKFWTSHLTGELAEAPMGKAGESFDEVIKEINDFTSESPGEVIMLKFRYLVGIRNVPSKGPIYWDQAIKDDFFSKLKQINNRCPNLITKDTTSIEQLTMGKLQENKGGCVLIFLDTKNLNEKISDENQHFSHKDGIYRLTDLSLEDAWVNKEDTKDVAEASIAEWQKKTTKFHVGQWLSTPHFLTSTFAYSLQQIAILPTNPALYWAGVNGMTPEKYPNVLMVDYIGMVLMNEPGWDDLSAELYTLAIGLNLYMVSENCDINDRRSPLLASKSKSMRLASSPKTNPLVSSWNGIIFANGSKIDHPPSWLHPGRVEIYKNGTVFSNGTVLEKSVPNPDFEIGPGITNSTLST